MSLKANQLYTRACPPLPFYPIPSHPDGVHCRDSFVSDMSLIYIQLFLRRLVVLFIIYLCMLFGFVLSLSHSLIFFLFLLSLNPSIKNPSIFIIGHIIGLKKTEIFLVVGYLISIVLPLSFSLSNHICIIVHYGMMMIMVMMMGAVFVCVCVCVPIISFVPLLLLWLVLFYCLTPFCSDRNGWPSRRFIKRAIFNDAKSVSLSRALSLALSAPCFPLRHFSSKRKEKVLLRTDTKK